jgi:hypothetical protein
MICLSTESCCMFERFEYLNLQWFTHEPLGANAYWMVSENHGGAPASVR